MGAQTLVAFRQQMLACRQRGGLEQVDHYRRGQHAYLAGPDARGGVFIADDDGGAANAARRDV